MDFVSHGLHYAIPTHVILSSLGVDQSIAIPAAILAGNINALPDTAGLFMAYLRPSDGRVSLNWLNLFGRKIFYKYRWDVYNSFHHGWAAEHFGWAFFVHLILDAVFHLQPGNWWPRLWYIAVPVWSIEVVFIIWWYVLPLLHSFFVF